MLLVESLQQATRRLVRVVGVFLLTGALASAGCWRRGAEPSDNGTSPKTEPSRADGGERTTLPFEFVDVAADRGLHRTLESGGNDKLVILENVGTGCAFLDADGDGRLDVFLANAGTISGGRIVPGPGSAYYRQTDTGSFEDRTRPSGLEFTGWGTGVAVGDVDNDGDPDLFLACYGPNRMYINAGDGTFSERADRMGLDDSDFSSSAVLFDYDADGFLDLYVVNYVVLDLNAPVNNGEPCLQRGVATACGPGFYEPAPDRLYRGEGGLRFREVTVTVGLQSQPGAYGLGVATLDYDDDGWLDLYVANDSTANFLWRNLGDGTFEEVALLTGTALSETGQGQAGMGVDAGDADGDGYPDLFVTNYSEEYFAYYRNVGGEHFDDTSHEAGLARETYMSLGWGTRWSDLDNDGDLDLVVAAGHVYPQSPQLTPATPYHQPCLLYLNDGSGSFTEVGAMAGDVSRPRAHRALAVGDVDNDGDPDVLMTVQNGRAVLLENRGRGSAHWLRVRLQGTQSNRDGIGARVELSAGGSRQVREVTRGGSYLSSHDVRVHFGLGGERHVEELIVRWPTRRKERFLVSAVDEEVILVEGQGVEVARPGSSPTRGVPRGARER